MRINTNILSLSAGRTLAQTSKAFARALEHLASGQRVNSARDDAAALGIGAGLEAQRRGLTQVIRNLNDAKGYLDTADGAMSVQTSIVQRMRELAVQAANGTYSSTDRANLNAEFQKLVQEYDRITTQTNFNGVNLLDGTASSLSLQVGVNKGDTISFTLPSTKSSQIFTSSYVDPGGAVYGTGDIGSSLNLAGHGTSFGHRARMGDVNNDGYDDVVMASSQGTGFLTTYLSQGNGSFTTGYAGSFGQVRSLELGDLNADGKLDLITVSGSTLQVQLGNGNGTFSAIQTLGPSITNEVGVQIADLNGDGKVDIVTASVVDGFVYAFLGNGNGTFVSPRTSAYIGAGGRDGTVNTGDFNEDGKLDLFAIGEILVGVGDGTFTPAITSASAFWGKFADINQDGHLDIVYSAGSADVLWNPGTGTGAIGAVGIKIVGSTQLVDVEVIDLNGDGKLDIVTRTQSDAYIGTILGNGNGTFQAVKTFAPYDGYYITSGDTNGDGVKEILNYTENTSNTVNLLYQSLIGGPATVALTNANLDISTQSAASNTLLLLDQGLSSLNSQRASVGAVRNRLDYAESVSSTTVENISSAKSQLLDADYAFEMAELTKQQILQQAGISVLAQANQNSRLALDLLKSLR